MPLVPISTFQLFPVPHLYLYPLILRNLALNVCYPQSIYLFVQAQNIQKVVLELVISTTGKRKPLDYSQHLFIVLFKKLLGVTFASLKCTFPHVWTNAYSLVIHIPIKIQNTPITFESPVNFYPSQLSFRGNHFSYFFHHSFAYSRISYKGNHTMLVCVQILLFSIIPVRSTHVV